MPNNLQVRHNHRVVITDDQHTYAEMRAVGSVDDVLKLAYLFAAAPELYEALTKLYELLAVCQTDPQTWRVLESLQRTKTFEQARAALQKANPSR